MADTLHKELVCHVCARWRLVVNSYGIRMSRISTKVHCERLWSLIYIIYHLFKVFIHDNWQNWSKYFLIHQRRIRLWVKNNCWLDMSNCRIYSTTIESFTTRGINKLDQTLQMKVINDFTLIFRAIWTFTPEALNAYNHHLYKPWNYLLVHEQIVRCDTSLTRIWKLGPTNLFDRVT